MTTSTMIEQDEGMQEMTGTWKLETLSLLISLKSERYNNLGDKEAWNRNSHLLPPRAASDELNNCVEASDVARDSEYPLLIMPKLHCC